MSARAVGALQPAMVKARKVSTPAARIGSRETVVFRKLGSGRVICASGD